MIERKSLLKEIQISQTSFYFLYLKALVNEDTLLPILRLRKLGNICCGLKMFLNKIKNIFCVPDTKFVSATNVARAGEQGNICVANNVSATKCPRLPGPLEWLKTVSSTFQDVDFDRP